MHSTDKINILMRQLKMSYSTLAHIANVIVALWVQRIDKSCAGKALLKAIRALCALSNVMQILEQMQCRIKMFKY